MQIAELFASLRIVPDKASLKKADQVIANTKRSLKRLVVVAGAAVVVMGKLISDTAKVADNFAKMSAKVGISIEKLQQLEFAAEISGTNIAVLRTGLQRFARTVDDAGQGLKSAEEPFKRLGINTKTAAGEVKDLDTLFLETADAISKLPDGIEKTALAMKAFGRAGGELIPLLNEGSEGIEKLREEFKGLGAQISTEDAKAFEEFNDTVLRVKTALVGFRNQAVIALLPHLKRISKAVLGWLKANRQMLKQRLVTFMKALIKVVKLAAKALLFMIKHVKLIAVAFVSWKIAILGVAIAQKIMAAGGVVAALKLAAAWAAAALPFILIAALIAGIILLIEDILTALAGGDSFTGDLIEAFSDAFGDVILEWHNEFGKFIDFVVSEIKDIPGRVTGAVEDFLQGGLDTEERREQTTRFRRTLGLTRIDRVRGARERQAAIEDEPDELLGAPRLPTTAAPSGGFDLEAFNAARTQAVSANITINGAQDPAAVADEVSKRLSEEARKLQGAR